MWVGSGKDLHGTVDLGRFGGIGLDLGKIPMDLWILNDLEDCENFGWI